MLSGPPVAFLPGVRPSVRPLFVNTFCVTRIFVLGGAISVNHGINIHRRSQGVHVNPKGGDKIFFWAKFTGKSCKYNPQAESATPRQSKSPIFRKLGDVDGEKSYLSSFSMCFEGDD